LLGWLFGVLVGAWLQSWQLFGDLVGWSLRLVDYNTIQCITISFNGAKNTLPDIPDTDATEDYTKKAK